MYESAEEKELSDYLSNPEVRHLYIDSSIRHLLAMQLRSMRETKEWSQIEVGNKAGMKQSAIARLEDPRYSSMTLSTLKRLAKAFDVALIVRFAPFSEFISWTTQIAEPRLSPPSFSEERNYALALVSAAVDANSIFNFSMPTASTYACPARTEKEKEFAYAGRISSTS
ncbi:MAG: helix-turn-helix transcriptional regulator [Dehalococcoidia bacterium]